MYPNSRRAFLSQASIGFGSLALASLLPEGAEAGCGRHGRDDTSEAEDLPANAALSQTHHMAQAKHVIFCFMSGGVSQVDSFDPKPKLRDWHGKSMPVKVERTQFNQNGNVMASPFSFKESGESGIPISDMFPALRDVADELAVIRSMTTSVNEHAQANFMMHSGFPFMGHPSAGAWCAYGLGCETEELPAYVVLQSGGAVPPHGGVGLFSNGFLPASHQGSILQADQAEAIRNLHSPDPSSIQRARLDFARELDHGFLNRTDQERQVEAAIQNAETAFRMQSAVPELCDLAGESDKTLAMYGLDSRDRTVAAYGRQCLMARRLVERGVRFIELSCLTKGIGAGGAPNPWDQHGDLERGHREMARQVDQPIAALIADLKQRGLLDETLIVWAGEFGRTPFSQGSNGRDHNPFGFSVWLAGGGIKGGTICGATDEWGYHAVDKPCQVYDLWATVLHQLGLNHERLTYRYSGRDFRLTDVHGNVLREVLS